MPYVRAFWVLLIAVAVSPAGAATICEQLILPGMTESVVAPRPAHRLNIRAALAEGKRLAKLDDRHLAARLRAELDGGLMISGGSANEVHDAITRGQFTGALPEARDRMPAVMDPRDREAFATHRRLHGLSSHDFVSTDQLRAFLVLPREHARVGAAGSHLMNALGLDQVHYAPLIPVLGQLAQQEGSYTSLERAAAALSRDPALAALAREAKRTAGEPNVDFLEDAVERRGFLLIFKRSAFIGRLHWEDPAAPGTVLALAPGRGLTQDDLYAIIPQSNVDLADLKSLLAQRQARPRPSKLSRGAPPPARIGVGQPRARRS